MTVPSIIGVQTRVWWRHSRPVGCVASAANGSIHPRNTRLRLSFTKTEQIHFHQWTKEMIGIIGIMGRMGRIDDHWLGVPSWVRGLREGHCCWGRSGWTWGWLSNPCCPSCCVHPPWKTDERDCTATNYPLIDPKINNSINPACKFLQRW